MGHIFSVTALLKILHKTKNSKIIYMPIITPYSIHMFNINIFQCVHY